MSKNKQDLLIQKVKSIRQAVRQSLRHTIGSQSIENLPFEEPVIDLEASFKKGLKVTMHDFKDGDVVHVMDHNGNIIDTGMYFGKKRINNIHHWLILSGKGYKELNTSFHSLIKSEPIEENK